MSKRLSFIAVFLLCVQTYAATASTHTLSQVRSDISNQQKKITQWTNQYNKEQQSLADIETKIARTHQEQADLKARQQALTTEIETLTKQTAALRQQHQEDYARWVTLTQSMAKTMYQGQVPYIFKGHDINTMQRHLALYRHLSVAQSQELQHLTQKLDALLTQYTALADAQALLKTTNEALQTSLMRLNTQRQTRQQTLQQLSQDIAQHQDKVRALQKDETKLQALLKKLKPKSPPKQKSVLHSFLYPVPKAQFLLTRTLPHQQAKQPNFIALPAGTTVHAVAPGEVVFAEWLRGVGLLVVIDHGEGLMTLYGHAERLLKDRGARVEAGEPVATAGQTGGLTETGLYFEIRQDGKAVSPEPWFGS